jgi:hypothetical protein
VVDFAHFPPLAPPGVTRKTTSPGHKVLFVALLAGALVIGARILVTVLLTVFWHKVGVLIGLAGPGRVSDASFHPPESARTETQYKNAKLEKILLEYRGTTVLNFVLDAQGKKINVLPWEHVKFFDADGKEIPRGQWGAYLQEGKTVLDVTTIRMIVSELGGEVELIKEWRIVKQ